MQESGHKMLKAVFLSNLVKKKVNGEFNMGEGLQKGPTKYISQTYRHKWKSEDVKHCKTEFLR